MKKLKINPPAGGEKLKTSNKNKVVFGIILIALGILFRTVWHLGPNVEFVTTAALLAGSYLGVKWAVIVPLTIMAVSDIFIGNTNIFIFTWSAYFLIGYLSNLSHLSNLNGVGKVLQATGLGIVASLWFYLWTNFGVWFLDSWGMYPRTFTGLIECYILALPFLKYNLMGNMVFVPSSFVLFESARFWLQNINFSELKIQVLRLTYRIKKHEL